MFEQTSVRPHDAKIDSVNTNEIRVFISSFGSVMDINGCIVRSILIAFALWDFCVRIKLGLRNQLNECVVKLRLSFVQFDATIPQPASCSIFMCCHMKRNSIYFDVN